MDGSLLNYVPPAPSRLTCLRVFATYEPYAPWCLRALCAFTPYVPSYLRCLRALRALLTRLTYKPFASFLGNLLALFVHVKISREVNSMFSCFSFHLFNHSLEP